jgi:L-asparaginase / beta-aspartyl-peptidase
MRPRIAMAVHGGAWDIPRRVRAAHRRGCLTALDAGLETLSSGGSTLDAVEAAIVVLENDITFDAGRGSFLNAAGYVELDAGIMDGFDLKSGAVAAVTAIPNPIRLARAVLETENSLIVGPGAALFADEAAIETCDPDWLIVDRERRRWNELKANPPTAREFFGVVGGTVGAVALDYDGNLAAGTSTGGLPFKPVGRVGDSPIVGAGVYAANNLAGVSVTGWGEAFVRLVWAYRAAALVTAEVDPAAACLRALDLLEPLSARGGIIMIDRFGRPAAAHNSPTMAYAYRTADSRAVAAP